MRDALLAIDRPALPGRWGKAGISSYLSSVLEGPESPSDKGPPRLATDWEKAFAFYSELFGWQKADAHVGAMGTYQQFSTAGDTIGGIHQACDIAAPFWLYYFTSATSRQRRSAWRPCGGQILYGPSAGRRLDRPLHGPSGRHIRAAGQAQPQSYRIFYFERVASRDPSDARGRRWSW